MLMSKLENSNNIIAAQSIWAGKRTHDGRNDSSEPVKQETYTF